jgi:hypothetical protein
MLNAKHQLAISAAMIITVTMTAGVAVGPAARAASPQLCHYHTARVSGGYVVQNNEWGSSAPECLTTRAGLAGFTVVRSAIATRRRAGQQAAKGGGADAGQARQPLRGNRAGPPGQRL